MLATQSLDVSLGGRPIVRVAMRQWRRRRLRRQERRGGASIGFRRWWQWKRVPTKCWTNVLRRKHYPWRSENGYTESKSWRSCNNFPWCLGPMGPMGTQRGHSPQGARQLHANPSEKKQKPSTWIKIHEIECKSPGFDERLSKLIPACIFCFFWYWVSWIRSWRPRAWKTYQNINKCRFVCKFWIFWKKLFMAFFNAWTVFFIWKIVFWINT